MAEQRDAREIIAGEIPWGGFAPADLGSVADAILAALAAEGWAVVRLEVMGGYDRTNPRYLYDEPAEWEFDLVPLYRVISPSTPEG